MQETAGLTVESITEKPEEVRLLEEPGELNQKLDIILYQVGDDEFSKPIPIEIGEEKICAPCGINRYPFNDVETIFEENSDYYLVGTEDKKGHVIRNMGDLKAHGVFPAIEDSMNMIDELVDTTAGHVFHEYEHGDLESTEFILYGSMNSFSEHCHFVASDLYGNGEAEDLEKIHSYLRFEHDEGNGYNLNMEKSKIRDSFGEYLERWVEETERFDLE